MDIYDIGLIFILWALSSMYFYSLGLKTGYLDGRKAVRKHYENIEKVRA